MNAKVASKEKLIKDVLSMLEKGMERADILQSVAKICKASPRKVDYAIKEAKIILNKRNEEAEVIRQSQVSETLKEAINENILSDLELEAILCKIASGKMSVEEIVRGQPILREVLPNEMVAAIDKLYKKRGSYAAVKQDVNITREQPLFPS